MKEKRLDNDASEVVFFFWREYLKAEESGPNSIGDFPVVSVGGIGFFCKASGDLDMVQEADNILSSILTCVKQASTAVIEYPSILIKMRLLVEI